MIKLNRFYKQDDQFCIVYEFTTPYKRMKESLIVAPTERGVRIAFARAIQSIVLTRIEQATMFFDNMFTMDPSSFCSCMLSLRYKIYTQMREPDKIIQAIELLEYTIKSLQEQETPEVAGEKNTAA